MTPVSDNKQEKRTARVTLAVTSTEKRAIDDLAKVWNTNASNLLRHHTVQQVVDEMARVRAALKAA